MLVTLHSSIVNKVVVSGFLEQIILLLWNSQTISSISKGLALYILQVYNSKGFMIELRCCDKLELFPLGVPIQDQAHSRMMLYVPIGVNVILMYLLSLLGKNNPTC